MANDTILDLGAGGDTIHTKDRAGVKTQVVGLDLTIAGGSETLMNGVMPVSDNAGSLTVDNAGTFATQDSQALADNAGFTDGTSRVFPVGLIFDEVAGTALTENDVAAPRIDSKRAQVLVIEDETTRGRRATVTAGNAVKVDNSAVTQPVSGTVSITANSAVNVAQMAGTTTDTNSGVKSAGTQRVVLATDQPQLTNALKVDGSAVTQPVSGTVTINAVPAGNNNIGDVDIVTVPAPLSTTGGGTEATAHRVTIANDSTGVLSVDDNGGSLTVDGTITANLAAGTNNIGDVDVLTLPGSLAGVADDAAFTVATTPVMPVGYLADQTSTDSVNEGDIGAARITLDRKQIVTNAPSADTEGWDTKNCTSGDGSTALTNTAQAIKASAGKLGGWYIYNPNATAVYVPLYDVASGSVTVGTTNPLMVLCIPATSAANLEMNNGITFGTAIAVAAATTAAGNTAPGTALDANFYYK